MKYIHNIHAYVYVYSGVGTIVTVEAIASILFSFQKPLNNF